MSERGLLRFEYRGEVSGGRLTYKKAMPDSRQWLVDSTVLGQLADAQQAATQVLPCQRITDPELLVGLLAYNHIHPPRFMLKPKDKAPVKVVLGEGEQAETYVAEYPGKSAFLYLLGEPTRETVEAIVGESMRRPRERTDHLHLATVARIEEAGWQVWWAPLPERGHWMHVRIVPGTYIKKGVYPSLEDAEKLRGAFVKAF